MKKLISLIGCAFLGFALILSCGGIITHLKTGPERSPHAREAAVPVSDREPGRDSPEWFLRHFRAPDEDYSSAKENPRPIIPTRTLTYQKERVRVWFVPSGTVEAPDFSRWKLVRFADPLAGEPLSPEIAAERMWPAKR
jgi:hypothetical protein